MGGGKNPVATQANLLRAQDALPSSDYESVLHAHAQHYTELLERQSQHFYGDPEQQGRRQVAAQRILSCELGNLTGALETAAQLKHQPWLMTLARHLWLPLHAASEFRLVLECGEKLLEQAGAVDNSEYKPLCLLFLARGWRNLSKYDQMLQSLKPILDDATAGSNALQATAKWLQGCAYTALSRHDDAAVALDAAAELWRSASDEEGVARATFDIAQLMLAKGNHIQAYESLLAISEHFRCAGNLRYESLVLNNLANLLIRMGRSGEAEPLAREALRLKSLLQDKRGMASNLVMLGCCAMDRKAYGAARETFTEALVMFDNLGVVQGAAACRGNLSMVLFAQGDLEAAEAQLEENLRLHQQAGSKPNEAMAHRFLALISLTSGQLETARQRLKAAYALASEYRLVREEALCAALTGSLLVKRGQAAEGAFLLNTALKIEAEMQLGFEPDIRDIIDGSLRAADGGSKMYPEDGAAPNANPAIPSNWRQLVTDSLNREK